MVSVAGVLICLVALYLAAYVLHFMAVWLGAYPMLGLVVAVVFRADLPVARVLVSDQSRFGQHEPPDVASDRDG